jgi:hypothetical protein
MEKRERVPSASRIRQPSATPTSDYSRSTSGNDRPANERGTAAPSTATSNGSDEVKSAPDANRDDRGKRIRRNSPAEPTQKAGQQSDKEKDTHAYKRTDDNNNPNANNNKKPKDEDRRSRDEDNRPPIKRELGDKSTTSTSSSTSSQAREGRLPSPSAKEGPASAPPLREDRREIREGNPPRDPSKRRRDLKDDEGGERKDRERESSSTRERSTPPQAQDTGPSSSTSTSTSQDRKSREPEPNSKRRRLVRQKSSERTSPAISEKESKDSSRSVELRSSRSPAIRTEPSLSLRSESSKETRERIDKKRGRTGDKPLRKR